MGGREHLTRDKQTAGIRTFLYCRRSGLHSPGSLETRPLRKGGECREDCSYGRGVAIRNISVLMLGNVTVSHETGVTCAKDGGSKKRIVVKQGGPESEDEDDVLPEKGDSDDDRSSAGSAEDSDEIGSDGGYESYGLADL